MPTRHALSTSQLNVVVDYVLKIEQRGHVGYSDRQILNDPRELDASLHLVRWLRCRFHITIANVIGRNESLSSPYHHERVASLRTQTHGDWIHADMQIYRHRLRELGACPTAAPGG
jgi:hypothetical protein